MYYAAQALLTADGIDVVKHSAVESPLGTILPSRGKSIPNSIGCSSMPVRSGKLPIMTSMRKSLNLSPL
jgi:hypothetical protein